MNSMTVNAKKKVTNHSRIPVFLSLLCSTMLFGGLSYFFFYNFETRLLNTQYNSIDSLFNFAIANEIEDKKNALLLMATHIATENPNASSWPYVHMPKTAFTKITDPLIEMAQLRTIGLLPIVAPEESKEFENYTRIFFEEQGYYDDLGVFDFGFGIYGKNTTSNTNYHCDGTEAAGEHDILLPIVQTGNLDQNIAAVMYNIYSEYHRASAVDYIFSCSNPGTIQCVSVTDFIYIVQDSFYRPAALVLFPILVSDGNGNNVTVGAIHGVINWDDVVEGSVPSFARGIEISISSGSETVFFRYEGPGTKYKASTISKGHSPFHSIKVDLQHTEYTINLSSTDAYEAGHRSWFPVIVSAIAVCITLLTALIFLLYDRSINHDLLMKEMDVETKRLFVRYISHEIRTPLNTVHLGLQVLHDEIDCLVDASQENEAGETDRLMEQLPVLEDWSNFVTNIDESAEDAILVLSDLLDFDKVSNGMMNFERDVHDISALIVDTVKPFGVNARAKKISLIYTVLEPCDMRSDEERDQTEHGGNSLVVYADDVKIQQVVRNLVSNALKFTPEGGTVEVTACWHIGGSLASSSDLSTPPNHTRAGCVVLRVVDSGAGLTPQQLSQLFQEGVQFDANKLQAGQGSGLGLWISKGVVTEHSGNLKATSQGKGCGTQFALELPVFLSPVPLNTADTMSLTMGTKQSLDLTPANRPLPLTDATAKTTKEARNPLVLVVDDSAATRKVMCRFLKNLGCDTIEAGDGQECLDIVATTKKPSFDLILMDFEMPVMNGPIATARLSASGCKIPIVGVTGHTHDEDIRAFMDRGSVDVLIKPITVGNLKKLLVSFVPAYVAERSIVNPTKTAIPQASAVVTRRNRDDSKILPLPSFEKRLILVVDDSAATRKVICRLLKRLGCDTIEAGDGQECLDIVATTKKPSFDLILMDFEMPVMNGPIATARLSASGCKIPIVGVTGNVLKTDTDFFISKGALEVLHKPLTIPIVKSLLSRIFGLDPLAYSSSPSNSSSEAIVVAPPSTEHHDDSWCLRPF